MKFYSENECDDYYWNKIKGYKLAAIYSSKSIWFFKNDKCHNSKNAAYIHNDNKFKEFCLNGKYYGDQNDFNKKSWRQFIKLQAFL